MFACCTPNVSAYSGIEPKLLIYGFANPLVICNETPNNIEKMKKIAIFLCLNKVNARNPNASTNDLVLSPLLVGQAGRVRAYNAYTTPIRAHAKNCPYVSCNPKRSTVHIEQMKPIVPKIRMGGKFFIVSNFECGICNGVGKG